jgi:hypothetical protein
VAIVFLAKAKKMWKIVETSITCGHAAQNSKDRNGPVFFSPGLLWLAESR